MKKVLDYLDIILLLFAVMIGLATTSTAIVLMRNSVAASQVEKTAQVALNNNVPVNPGINGNDLILMYVVADPYMQAPVKIQIDDHPTEVFNLDWFKNRESNISRAWNSFLKDYRNLPMDSVELYYADGELRWRYT